MRRLAFDGTAGASLDPAVWQADTHGWYDAQHTEQAFTARPDNVAVDGAGNLLIVARAEPWPTASGGVKAYTSGRVTSVSEIPVGSYVESLVSTPNAAGCWPALWFLGADEYLTGWPRCGELDLLECYPSLSPNRVWRTLHQADAVTLADVPYGSNVPHCYTDFGEPVSAKPRLYGIHADSNGVRFYIDRRVVQTVTRQTVEALGATWPYGRPVRAVASLAVGDLAGTPNPADYPATMVVGPLEVWPPGTVVSSLPPYRFTPTVNG